MSYHVQAPPVWRGPAPDSEDHKRFGSKVDQDIYYEEVNERKSKAALQEHLLGRVDRSSPRFIPVPREVDSGITALETPLDSRPSTPVNQILTPFSTDSAPAAVAGSFDVGSAGSSSVESTPPSSPSLPPVEQLKVFEDDFAMAQLVHPQVAFVLTDVTVVCP